MPRTCLLLFLACAPLFAAQEPESPPAREKTVPRILSVIDLVVKHHIDPPTRQQLTHDVCRTLTGQYGLGRQISAASSNKQLSQILEKAVAAKSDAAVTTALTQALRSIRIPANLTDSENHKVNKQVAENRYVGTGIQLAMNPRPVMQKVFEDGPAYLAGAKDGDVIERIDGKSTNGMNIQEVVTMLRGPSGSTVDVTLKQPDATSRDYTITRGLVPLRTIEKPVYFMNRQAAYLRFTSIASSAVHELRKILSDVDPATNHVVLDFRGVSNHNLHHARLLADAMLDDRPIGSVVETGKTTAIRSEPGDLLEDMRITVVVDSTTSGTAEWIAAALLTNKRADVYGQPTAGAAFVSESFTAADILVAEIPVGYLQTVEGQTLVGAVLTTNPRMPQGLVLQKTKQPYRVYPNMPAASEGSVEEILKDLSRTLSLIKADKQLGPRTGSNK